MPDQGYNHEQRQVIGSYLEALVECVDDGTPWPLDRSGFSAFVGEPISQPTDRPRLERILNYILRPALPLKHLSYVESTGQVRYALEPGRANVCWFANALGKLNPKKEPAEETSQMAPQWLSDSGSVRSHGCAPSSCAAGP